MKIVKLRLSYIGGIYDTRSYLLSSAYEYKSIFMRMNTSTIKHNAYYHATILGVPLRVGLSRGIFLGG